MGALQVTQKRDHGGGIDAAAAKYGGARADWIDLSTGINPVPYPVPDLPGTSWRGKGIDLLYSVCTEASRAFTRGLGPGAHTIEMRASLPGTKVRFRSEVSKVELLCPESR